MFTFLLCVACNIGFCILNYNFSGRRVDICDSAYGFYPFMILSAIGGIGATILVSANVKSNMITHIGANSLIYFGWHQRIFIPISAAVVSLINSYLCFDNTWSSFITFILVLLLCAMVENVVTRTKLKVFIGKF